MKRSLFAVVLMGALTAPPAHSALESFFQAEIGLGAAQATGWHDGIWTQQNGVPHAQSLVSPAFLVGLSGQVWSHARFDLRYHLDYLYIGTSRASCDCVSDADYAAGRYNAQRTAFSGSGHTQGMVVSLAPGFAYAGFRLGLEAGVFLEWATWHESAGSIQVNHKTSAQVAPLIGASLERGPFALRFLHFSKSQSWNPYPQFTSGANVVLGTWRF